MGRGRKVLSLETSCVDVTPGFGKNLVPPGGMAFWRRGWPRRKAERQCICVETEPEPWVNWPEVALLLHFSATQTIQHLYHQVSLIRVFLCVFWLLMSLGAKVLLILAKLNCVDYWGMMNIEQKKRKRDKRREPWLPGLLALQSVLCGNLFPG